MIVTRISNHRRPPLPTGLRKCKQRVVNRADLSLTFNKESLGENFLDENIMCFAPCSGNSVTKLAKKNIEANLQMV